MPAIRTATHQDAAALARLAEATFRDTFAASNSAANMDAHCRSNYGPAQQAREIADPSMQTLVAEHEGALVAYAQLRVAAAPACVHATHPGEILRLYVHRDWHGCRLAQRLMDACLAALGARGADVAWLGVWEHNPRAIAFYRKSGFAEVGDHVFLLGDDPQRDVVMMRALALAAGPCHLVAGRSPRGGYNAPMETIYVHRAPVRFTHTDPAGYVFFPRFFEMFQAAVEDWFTHCLGLNYAEQILKHGIGFPTARTECDFLRPCRLGETLCLRLVLEQVGRSSLTLRFVGSVDGEPRLRARSVLVAIEMVHGRPRPIEGVLRERLDAYLGHCRDDA